VSRRGLWLRPGCFSGRTVISPGPDLAFDQLGLAEDIAWTIFGPLLRRQLDGEEIEARTPKAAKTLDKLMAETWVLLNRAPSVLPTSILAFHAVRIPEPVIRLHPLACALLNADFDGDQAAVFLPITEAGQAEAGEKLTVAAHLRRNPRLYEWLVTPAGDVLHYLLPSQDILWGLAMLSLTPAGQKEIAELAGVHVEMPEGCLTRQALEAAMRMLLARDGAEAVLDALQRLMQRGFEAAKASGASISPFIGQTLRPRPPAPEDNPQAWERHREQIAEQLAGRTEFDDDDLGPQLLAVKSGSRGGIDHLARLVGPAGWTTDAEDKPFFVAGGLRDGYTPQELFARAATARRALGQVALSVAESGAELRAAGVTKAFTVLARAMRAEHPGVVFAAAAATGQIDPLRDPDSRLFVGLAPPAAQP